VDEAEQAMKYVIFLVNVDALYNVALGMYDFSLVVMVAQHSHKVKS
jgi:elongator complex protein 1